MYLDGKRILSKNFRTAASVVKIVGGLAALFVLKSTIATKVGG